MIILCHFQNIQLIIYIGRYFEIVWLSHICSHSIVILYYFYMWFHNYFYMWFLFRIKEIGFFTEHYWGQLITCLVQTNINHAYKKLSAPYKNSRFMNFDAYVCLVKPFQRQCLLFYCIWAKVGTPWIAWP